MDILLKFKWLQSKGCNHPLNFSLEPYEGKVMMWKEKGNHKDYEDDVWTSINNPNNDTGSNKLALVGVGHEDKGVDPYHVSKNGNQG